MRLTGTPSLLALIAFSLTVTSTTAVAEPDYKEGWTEEQVITATYGCVRSVLKDTQNVLDENELYNRPISSTNYVRNVEKSCDCISHAIATSISLDKLTEAPEYYSSHIIASAFASGECPVPVPVSLAY